jgi:hypothetical protein
VSHVLTGHSGLVLAAILLTGLHGGLDAAQSVGSRPVALSDLTVPRERLAEGCALSPGPVLGLSTNPWLETDRQAVASLRQGMGEVPVVTDAPLTRRDASSYKLLLAEGIEEGYAAVYTPSEGERTLVRALRFSGRPPERSSKPLDTTRLEIGRIVVLVSGDRGECFRSVEAYLKSLSS